MAINNGLPACRINALQCLNNYVFAGTETEGIYKSPAHGSLWTQATEGLPAESGIRAFFSKDDTLLTGTVAGEIYFSADDGESWIYTGEGIAGSPILCIFYLGHKYWAGVNGTGLWNTTYLGFTATENSFDILPFKIYPNPVRTSFRWESKEKITSMGLTNSSGRLIQKVNASDNTGEINTAFLAPGIYHLFLIIGRKYFYQRIIVAD